ncbi:MAG: NUDIX hydrolase [Planctomycetota bacterium]
MHRQKLIRLLQRYAQEHEGEGDLVQQFEQFVASHDDCLLRSCVPGHITASAWILSPTRDAALLTHHKKLGKWLQLGGHVDGEAAVEQACLREAQEESGMQRFTLVQAGSELVPLDLDVHEIPARKLEPRHLHWDVRFLLLAAPDQPLVLSEESHDLAWAPLNRLRDFTEEESVLRLQRKSVELLRRSGRY